MKFKLDENLGSRTAGIIAESGHDVETIAQEKLSGTSGERLYDICIAEGRCLDFAGPRLRRRGSVPAEQHARHSCAAPAASRVPRPVDGLGPGPADGASDRINCGRLWAVEAGRIRVYEEAAP